ncbi:MAG TPA: hypothetical protein VNQ74_03530 [Burkholderiaceae bacterium]|nr:hypothetical protein [Burkholderiaceae bacterium]
MSLHPMPPVLRLQQVLNAYRESLLPLEMRQHCTPVRNISIGQRGSGGEG